MYNKRVKELKRNGKIPIQLRRKDRPIRNGERGIKGFSGRARKVRCKELRYKVFIGSEIVLRAKNSASYLKYPVADITNG